MERETLLAVITIAALAVVLWNWSKLMALFHSEPAPLTDSVLVTDTVRLQRAQALRAEMLDRLAAKFPDEVRQRDDRIEGDGALRLFIYPGKRLPEPYAGRLATYSPPELTTAVYPRCIVILKSQRRNENLLRHELLHDVIAVPGHPDDIFGPPGTLTFRI